MLFADLSLARRLEAADSAKYLDYAAAHGRLRPDIGVTWEPVAGGYAVYAGAGNPYSRGIGLGLNGPVSADEFERFEAFFRARGLTPEVSLCPLADDSVIERLAAASYGVRMFMQTWFRETYDEVRRTENERPKTEDGGPPTAGEIVVRPIRPEEANLWVLTAHRGFAGDDATVPPDSIVAAYPHMAHATCWLAWLPGSPIDEPAGAGSLALHDGIAELFGTSTRPSSRGRGVQTALMQARMAAAAAAGCDVITVHTDPGGASQRNVERAGFRLAYTKVIMSTENLRRFS
jgi:GNAT superfamily N-acetyltransferase